MSRASALASRFRLRARQEGTHRTVPVVKTGERPYDGLPAAQVAAYRAAAARERLAPRLTFTTAPAAETRPMAAVPDVADMPNIAPVCAQAATTDPAELARAVPAIREIDFTAVDAAREQEGLTHAGVRSARAAAMLGGIQGDPLDKATPVTAAAGPVIGDSLPVPAPAPAQAALFEAAPPRPAVLPYTAPGWAGLQMSRWVARGEWDDVLQIAERGLGRNVAEAVTGFRHSRETIAGMRQRCAAIGRPDLADLLLRHVQELNLAARAQAAQAGAA